jgi:hypothetical protein
MTLTGLLRFSTRSECCGNLTNAVSNYGRGPNAGGLDHAQYAELKREQCRLPNFGFIHPGFGFRPRHLFNQRPAGQFFEHGINPLNLRTIPRWRSADRTPSSTIVGRFREQVREPPRLRLHSRSRQPRRGVAAANFRAARRFRQW